MWVVRSGLDTVWENLALEEYLLEASLAHGGALFFCRNRSSVVLGKNQNPWRECRVERMARQGVGLARRISGGGTVYHDEGNLNYGLILPRAAYDRERCFAWILSALYACGISASRHGTTSLAAGTKKISGTAFAFKKGAVLHHGTLLVQSDLRALRDAMRCPDARVEGHAIPSDPADVANLCDFRPGLRMETVADALISKRASFFGGEHSDSFGHDALDASQWKSKARTLRTRAWQFGRTPPFRVSLSEGDRETVALGIRSDRITHAWIHTDQRSPSQRLPLEGLRFRPVRLAARLRSEARDTDPFDAGLLSRAASLFSSAWS